MNIPEKWGIKHYDEVGEWFNKMLGKVCSSYTGSSNDYLHSHNLDDQCISEPTEYIKSFSYFRGAKGQVDVGFTEITIEQFREYVSKTTATPVQQDYSYITKLLKTLKIK